VQPHCRLFLCPPKLYCLRQGFGSQRAKAGCSLKPWRKWTAFQSLEHVALPLPASSISASGYQCFSGLMAVIFDWQHRVISWMVRLWYVKRKRLKWPALLILHAGNYRAEQAGE